MRARKVYTLVLIIFLVALIARADNTVNGGTQQATGDPIDGEVIIGDFNNDNTVNVTDLVILIKKLNNPDDASLSKYNCDLTNDNVVDQKDLATLKDLILNASISDDEIKN